MRQQKKQKAHGDGGTDSEKFGEELEYKEGTLSSPKNRGEKEGTQKGGAPSGRWPLDGPEGTLVPLEVMLSPEGSSKNDKEGRQ